MYEKLNLEAVKMIKQFMVKHGLTDKELIIDVQGNGFLKEIFNLVSAKWVEVCAFSGRLPQLLREQKKLYERV